ncbi:hypothetical protein AAE478_009214 [Parahypoxylon ruwenzoriense]
MPVLGSAKRGASPAEKPWPDPVAKRAKVEVKKEEDENRGSPRRPSEAGRPRYWDPDFRIETKEEKTPSSLDDFEGIYPSELMKKVKARKLGGKDAKSLSAPAASSSNRNGDGNRGIDAVYVVTLARGGGAGDWGFDIAGTYDNVAAANFHAMRLYHEDYSPMVEILVEDRSPPDYSAHWWIDSEGALSLWGADGKFGGSRACVTKQRIEASTLPREDLVSVSY